VLVGLTLITAGALGNIIDCLFYGLVFTPHMPFMQGRVVDMFYFPIIDTHLPEWVPIWGGDHFIFFSPVFNFADACISVGVILMLLFCRKELSTISFSKKKTENEADKENEEKRAE
jgi:signal peptidase II